MVTVQAPSLHPVKSKPCEPIPTHGKIPLKHWEFCIRKYKSLFCKLQNNNLITTAKLQYRISGRTHCYLKTLKSTKFPAVFGVAFHPPSHSPFLVGERAPQWLIFVLCRSAALCKHRLPLSAASICLPNDYPRRQSVSL